MQVQVGEHNGISFIFKKDLKGMGGSMGGRENYIPKLGPMKWLHVIKCQVNFTFQIYDSESLLVFLV